MHPSVRFTRDLILASTAVLLLLLVGSALAGFPGADAQTAGVTVTQFPGLPVAFDGKIGETHTVNVECPAGYFAIAGGHAATPDTVAVIAVESYPSQLPGLGAGVWTLTLRKLDKPPVTVTPYVSCLGGVTQLPE